MTTIRSPYLVRCLISVGTSRGRRVIRARGRHPVISVAGMRYPDLLSRNEKECDAPRRNWLIRDKFCAIGSADKTRELAGTRKYDPRLALRNDRSKRRSPTECYAHTPQDLTRKLVEECLDKR